MAIIKTTYKDQVVEHIYQLILAGTLEHGDQLKESVLSLEMGISRAPIREALKELIGDGIIEYRPQVGNFITQLSPRETVDAYITRGVLEGFAIMDTHDQFSSDEIEELEALTTSMEKSAKKNDHKRVISIGGEFHDKLVGKNRNIQLTEYTERLSKKLHILFYKYWSSLYSPDEIGDRHRRIIQVLKADNPRDIEETIRQHYAETGNKIASLLNSNSK